MHISIIGARKLETCNNRGFMDFGLDFCISLQYLDSIPVMRQNTVMVAERATSYTIDELSERVAQLLEERGLNTQQDNRVSSAPDRRTIRYYTSLGLLDRPSIEGRQARYGERHVLQILAIKALQSVSLPLSEIQSLLFGSTDEELENVVASVQESNRVKTKLLKKDSFKEISHVTRMSELVIEPGLRLLVEEGWKPNSDTEQILDRMRAVLEALQSSSYEPGSGGNLDGREEDFG